MPDWGERMGRQLQAPGGIEGVLVGELMRWINAGPYAHALKALSVREGEAVLELGFGPGAGLRRLAATPAGAICGLDHSATMLASARRRNRGQVLAGRMDLRCGRFDALPWKDSTFDWALLVNVVYFFADDGAEMRELHRTLRRSGQAVIFAIAEETMRKWPFAGPTTHRMFDARSLGKALGEGGFRPQRIQINRLALPFGVSGLLAIARKD